MSKRILAAAALAAAAMPAAAGAVLEQGRPFPDLVLESIDGGKGSIADYRGRKIALHVFASW